MFSGKVSVVSSLLSGLYGVCLQRECGFDSHLGYDGFYVKNTPFVLYAEFKQKYAQCLRSVFCGKKERVGDGTRTRDPQDHNLVL